MEFVANIENYQKYNFAMTLENQIKHFVRNEKYSELVTLLEEHLNGLINTIKYFGDNKMAQKFLEKMSDLIEYECLPFHKCKYFNTAIMEIRNEVRSCYPSDNYCIELMEKCIRIVKVQYNLLNE